MERNMETTIEGARGNGKFEFGRADLLNTAKRGLAQGP